MAFIFAISVVLGIYVVGVSMAVLLRCGGSVLENIYTGLLIVFGIGKFVPDFYKLPHL